jgi:hypothetical protein
MVVALEGTRLWVIRGSPVALPFQWLGRLHGLIQALLLVLAVVAVAVGLLIATITINLGLYFIFTMVAVVAVAAGVLTLGLAALGLLLVLLLIMRELLVVWEPQLLAALVVQEGFKMLVAMGEMVVLAGL